MDFIDPPVNRKGAISEKWLAIARELQENPNKWALVGDFTPGVATHLRRGKYPAFLEKWIGPSGDEVSMARYMADHWEVTARKVQQSSENEKPENKGKERHNIYMRWLG